MHMLKDEHITVELNKISVPKSNSHLIHGRRIHGFVGVKAKEWSVVACLNNCCRMKCNYCGDYRYQGGLVKSFYDSPEAEKLQSTWRPLWQDCAFHTILKCIQLQLIISGFC
jgi:hypothetical protein